MGWQTTYHYLDGDKLRELLTNKFGTGHDFKIKVAASEHFSPTINLARH